MTNLYFKQHPEFKLIFPILEILIWSMIKHPHLKRWGIPYKQRNEDG